MAKKKSKDGADNQFVTLPVGRLEPNTGQLEGLPENPRKISDEKLELLKENIVRYPDMLSIRGLMVYPLDNGNFIVICGNMRHRAMMELGIEDVPCVVLPKETDIERLKAYSVIDNNGFGRWEWDMLANEWDEAQLTSWGVDLMFAMGDFDSSGFFDEDDGGVHDGRPKIKVVVPKELEASMPEIKSEIEEFLKQYDGCTVK